MCFIIPLAKAYTYSTSIEHAVFLLLRSTNGISLWAMSFRPISCNEVTKSPSVRLGYSVSIKLSKLREGLGLFRKESRSSREIRSYRLAKRSYSRLKPRSSFLHIQSYTSICLALSSSRVNSPEDRQYSLETINFVISLLALSVFEVTWYFYSCRGFGWNEWLFWSHNKSSFFK